MIDGCSICVAYFERRLPVLGPAMALRAFQRQVQPAVVVREYAHGVHLRHLAGLSLDTSPAVAS